MANIYIVEDDTNIQEIEAIALKNSGHNVEQFEDAKHFYKKIEEKLPDLAILDIMLPDENGYEIVKKLRKNPATKKLPVIMVTAKTSEIDMVKGLDIGADDYIKKPFSIRGSPPNSATNSNTCSIERFIFNSSLSYLYIFFVL